MCSRSCVQNAHGHVRLVDIWKQSSRPVRRCRLDDSESLPKSAVFFARFFPRREVNIMRTRTWHKRPANALTFKLAFSSRRRWHTCQSFGQLSPTHATIKKPSARLHVRADLPAMTESPNNEKIWKIRKETCNPSTSVSRCTRLRGSSCCRRQSTCHTFRCTFEERPSKKTMEISNSLRSTAWCSRKASLSMVWLATPLL